MVLLLGLLVGCGGGDAEPVEDPVSSRSYKGHENDRDANNLVAAYPAIVGTRLDDCQTCHTGRIEEGRLMGSACDQCHDLVLHGGEQTATATLNPFGRQYLEAGRSVEALRAIMNADSDGDGFSNHEEMLDGRYPGSELSMPGQTVATLRTVSLDELKALPPHQQFMLSNTSKQKYDDYVNYTGVKIVDLLEAEGIDLAGATGITVIAPDGYMKSLPIEQATRPYPQAPFHGGLDLESLGPNYPETLPDGVADGEPIPGEPWMMLGYARDGAPLESSSLDVARGRMVGEGPLRMVVPQAIPGKPDRGSRVSPSGCDDGFDYIEEADHNAGAMVRGVIAIRIDPIPVGVEEFDYMNGGWAFIDAGQLIVYGHGVR